jgi:hypothetical protein
VVTFPLGTIPTFLIPISVLLYLYSMTLLWEGRARGRPSRSAT